MKRNKASSKKSAIGIETTVFYIILVISALALIGIVIVYTQETIKDIKTTTCKWDIQKAALSKEFINPGKLGTKGHKITTLNNCRREKLGYLEIKYEDVVEKDKINQDKASRIIADKMAECWDMVGAGKIDPFSNWDVNEYSSITEFGASFCMICTTIKFDGKLQNYYIKNLESGKSLDLLLQEDKLIKSPIPWMVSQNITKGKSYYTHIYKSEAQYTDKELEDMEKFFLIPETTIMVKLFKLKDREMWTVIARVGLIGGGVIIGIAGLALSITGISAAIIGIPLIAKAGTVLTIAGVTLTIFGTATQVGVMMVDPVNTNPFSECEECNGIGSIKVIPPQIDLAQEVRIEYKIPGKETIKEEGPYCRIVIN